MKLETQLKRLGFTLEHQGGGLNNWRKVIPSAGIELFCCAEDGTEPEDDLPAVYGVMPANTSEESLCHQQYATGTELAERLEGLCAL